MFRLLFVVLLIKMSCASGCIIACLSFFTSGTADSHPTSLRIADLSSSCVLAGVLPGTDSSRTESLVCNSKSFLCSLILFVLLEALGIHLHANKKQNIVNDSLAYHYQKCLIGMLVGLTIQIHTLIFQLLGSLTHCFQNPFFWYLDTL